MIFLKLCIISFFIVNLEATTIFIKGGIYTIPPYNDFYSDTKKQIIKIDPFYIDKYEVSNKKFHKKDIGQEEIEYPVVNISYQEAANYCKKHKGSLPTVEQWIVASSFEKDRYYPFATKNYPILDQNDINIKNEKAIELETDGFGAEIDLVNVSDALVGNNQIVGMLGNIWEITLSKTNYTKLKGGSFFNNSEKGLLNNIIENKVLKIDLKGYEHVGFRCVYKIDE
jgi:formylglycine-generating enzyme required for sulfatase activity